MNRNPKRIARFLRVDANTQKSELQILELTSKVVDHFIVVRAAAAPGHLVSMSSMLEVVSPCKMKKSLYSFRSPLMKTILTWLYVFMRGYRHSSLRRPQKSEAMALRSSKT